MRNPLPSILYFFIAILVVTGCRIQDGQEANASFTWDMDVENHTGISKNLHAIDGKHRGMSVFNWSRSDDQSINQLIKNNVEWVALVPFLYQRTDTTKTIRPKAEFNSWDRRDQHFIDAIEKIHNRGLKIMLKPHLWMREGWRSKIRYENDEEWDTWFESYRMHMLHYAKMAEENDVALYCIGTEFESSMRQQPDKWVALVKEIKSIYKGKLTYAANWDGEYEIVPFWKELDYIGIQAYFPITSHSEPSIKEVRKGWKRHIKTLETLSEKHNKPILFSEIGYRSDANATIKPWEWNTNQDSSVRVSFFTQHVAFEGLFQELWHKDWFAGMYVWEWHVDDSGKNRGTHKNFTPRFKPAENTLAKWYGKG